jgi:hypothetical protein
MSATQSVYSQHQNAAYGQRPVGSAAFKMPSFNVQSTPDDPSEPQKIGFNKRYLTSIVGICRLVLIACLLAGWIAAVLVIKNNDNSKADGYSGFTSTRTAYLVFGISGYIIYTILFFLQLANIINVVGFLRKLPLEVIFLGLDIFFLLSMFSVSVAAAVRENQLGNYESGIYDTFLLGAFAAASVSLI